MLNIVSALAVLTAFAAPAVCYDKKVCYADLPGIAPSSGGLALGRDTYNLGLAKTAAAAAHQELKKGLYHVTGGCQPHSDAGKGKKGKGDKKQEDHDARRCKIEWIENCEHGCADGGCMKLFSEKVCYDEVPETMRHQAFYTMPIEKRDQATAGLSVFHITGVCNPSRGDTGNCKAKWVVDCPEDWGGCIEGQCSKGGDFGWTAERAVKKTTGKKLKGFINGRAVV